ncbi:hypothetical protein C1H76_6719 [Elsinoe australis]|uniref:Maintenance of telomere capping protein 6 n=1 Tax=Elsinoe australis TaxID=40998 RepID=A0A4U7ASA4_9PEZI|nr:hypothetical protein C1H76_6719 [Elsinoe australis]
MSQEDYVPDPAAVPSGTLATSILSQRDLSSRIPINFVTHPTVTLKSVCFADDRYEDNAIRKCLSNLLATGYRRILLDVYWNPLLAQWSICPGAVPAIASNPASSSSEQTRSAAQTTGLSLSDLPTSGVVARGLPTAIVTTVPNVKLQRRQTTDTQIPDSSSSSASSLTSDSESAQPTEVADSPSLFQVGPYQCTSTANINLIRDVFEDHFVNTGNNLNATLKYLIINVHNAELLPDQDGDSGSTPSLTTISRALNTTLSPFIYTPALLQEQRANLNASWFTAPFDQQPDTLYFRYGVNSSGIASTTDGWPSEGYAELIEAKRILIGFGESSLPANQYDTSLDDLIIFPPGSLTSPREVAVSSTGAVTSGCLFVNTSLSPLSINDSFVIPSSSSPTFSTTSGVLHNTTTSLSACGISPLLNTTLSNTSAGSDIQPYRSFVRASIWSWQSDQPASSPNNTQNRCAALNITAPQGRWEVAACTSRLPGACRIANQPYEWTLSTQRGPYDSIPRVCPSNSTFSVPRTALENSYLRATIARLRDDPNDGSLAGLEASLIAGANGDEDLRRRDVSLPDTFPGPYPDVAASDTSSLHLSTYQKRQDADDILIWLNLNDLDVQGCFVQGINATCPYTPRAGEASRRVIVPIVAAVIVFCLAGLTIFVKCAANRAGVKRKRRRKGLGRGGDGLGEYEGVPS